MAKTVAVNTLLYPLYPHPDDDDYLRKKMEKNILLKSCHLVNKLFRSHGPGGHGTFILEVHITCSNLLFTRRGQLASREDE
jgi:hypothetical protein